MRIRDTPTDRMRAALNLAEPYDLPLTSEELRARIVARNAKKNGRRIGPQPENPNPADAVEIDSTDERLRFDRIDLEENL